VMHVDPSGESLALGAIIGVGSLIVAGYLLAQQGMKALGCLFNPNDPTCKNPLDNPTTTLDHFSSACVTALEEISRAYQSTATVSNTTTFVPSTTSSSISIPVPEECIGEECTRYLNKLLMHLKSLTEATLASLASEFTIYGDGGKMPPPGIPISKEDIRRGGPSPASPVYPFTIAFGPNNVNVSMPSHKSDASGQDWITSGEKAAVHVYIEFRLGSISQVFDNKHPLGDGDIGSFHANLHGVHWRDCRRYQGLTPVNVGKALEAWPRLQLQAQGFNRSSSLNRLGQPCPLG